MRQYIFNMLSYLKELVCTHDVHMFVDVGKKIKFCPDCGKIFGKSGKDTDTSEDIR